MSTKLDYRNLPKSELEKLHAFVALARLGIRVFQHNKGYELIATHEGKDIDPLIKCNFNDHCIGLFHTTGTGANAIACDLFIEKAGE